MRLVIVSNRLPKTAVEKEGKWMLTDSVGGVATGLRTYLSSLAHSGKNPDEYIWVGWPGATIEESQRELLKAKSAEFHSYPVFLSREQMQNFYHGFCNKTIWPLFHYFPSYAVYKTDYWLNYVEVNEIFFRALLPLIKEGDIVWVHDYHLMLLPKMLRDRLPNPPIGFFLHIPFPSYEIFRLLPTLWRNQILEGLLGADLIGFHTQDYVQYFLRCVSRLLGYEHKIGEIMMPERLSKVDRFPMGIHFRKFLDAAAGGEVEKQKTQLKKRFAGSRLILSIDRLDYSKGILNRLRGFEEFLERNKESHGKVVLLLVVVPSRIGVEHYQRMKKEIDQLVGRLNGRFGTLQWTPIVYQYRALTFLPMVALYSASEIILVTPLRDGMNLIAKEYIASRKDQTGVLILSEMAGAARELGEAIIINPNNAEEIAIALERALRMQPEEQIRRNRNMQMRLERYDVTRWAEDFIQSLCSFHEQQKKFRTGILGAESRRKLVNHFRVAKRRLILLDYDGTLVGFASDPKNTKPPDDLLVWLDQLSHMPGTDLVLVSGRDRVTLDQWFGTVDISLVAEHGAWSREKNNKTWKTTQLLGGHWKTQLLSLLSPYVDRLPGSFIEEKDFSLAFHYREADPELASVRTKELMDNLLHFTANIDVQVLRGAKVIEMRNSSINKGNVGRYFLSHNHYDFVLAVGDDWTDEDLFRVLPAGSYSIKVGMGFSYAANKLLNHDAVLGLIRELVMESDDLSFEQNRE